MRKPEQKFWDQIREEARPFSRILRLQRHEDRLSSDIPDVSYSLGDPDDLEDTQRVNGWLELKYAAPKIDSNTMTRVLSIPHFSQGQRKWLAETDMRGGNAFLFLKIKLADHDRYYLLHGATAGGIVGLEPIRRLDVVACHASYGKIDWEKLIDDLGRKKWQGIRQKR